MNNSAGQTVTGWLSPKVTRLLQSNRGTKRLLAGLTDGCNCLLAAWISFAIRLGVLSVFTRPFLLFTAAALLTTIGVFIYRGVYNNVFRFHGPKGLAQIAQCCVIIGAILVLAFGFNGVAGVPRTVSVLFPAVFFIFVAISRIVARFILVEMLQTGDPPQRVLIYGAGTRARQLASSLQHQPSYRLIAFASNEETLAGQRLEGTPIVVAGNLADLLEELDIDLVLLALDKSLRSERAAIVEKLQALGVHVQTLPDIHELVSGDVSVSDLREIDIADLLSRDQVMPDPALMDSIIAGKTVLVTGAGGSIGSEICRQIARRRPAQLILFDMTEAALFEIEMELRSIVQAEGIGTVVVTELGTLVETAAVHRIFGRYHPHTVFHAAAYKHVPMVEANPISGVRNNVMGTLASVRAAVDWKVERFVLVSTDKAVRPTNVMGASKRVCELILQAYASREGPGPIFSMVRFGNVLGSSGSVVPQFRKQIEAGGPVTLTHSEVTRYFMTILEAAELVIQAGAMARGGEVYLLDMGEPVRIVDLARSMIQMSGLSVRDKENPHGDIEIVQIGLRPGEKLYEELLINAEATATDHPRIFCAHESHLGLNQLAEMLAKVERALETANDRQVRYLLSELVSGYDPSDSPNCSAADPPVATDDHLVENG
ncbi:nucleoside-diphosphate sugar epimerase/dehydratase [Parafrankia sp. BMG5.11]|uniref:polysaccharide biosynthesis protein n=1 Tax=Parafrankia sp. BMG5.11 TaxID=222540 RepID=UPI00103D86F7|nr:nucleoside-diphosphate sugar epimerase/dehydratase [Parafrankia sp. BMG5.11]TCJ40226.1 polysaccharide biosynthesis protein [Parafrankia sp. BMG5.11]